MRAPDKRWENDARSEVAEAAAKTSLVVGSVFSLDGTHKNKTIPWLHSGLPNTRWFDCVARSVSSGRCCGATCTCLLLKLKWVKRQKLRRATCAAPSWRHRVKQLFLTR